MASKKVVRNSKVDRNEFLLSVSSFIWNSGTSERMHFRSENWCCSNGIVIYFSSSKKSFSNVLKGNSKYFAVPWFISGTVAVIPVSSKGAVSIV